MNKTFGILFLLTGVFSIIGGLYTWGEGNIRDQVELIKVLIPWADIIFTGPFSIICSYGILKKLNWGQTLGLVTSGIYIFGSILVFISLIWNHAYPWYLVVPASSGFMIGLGYVLFSLRNINNRTQE